MSLFSTEYADTNNEAYNKQVSLTYKELLKRPSDHQLIIHPLKGTDSPIAKRNHFHFTFETAQEYLACAAQFAEQADKKSNRFSNYSGYSINSNQFNSFYGGRNFPQALAEAYHGNSCYRDRIAQIVDKFDIVPNVQPSRRVTRSNNGGRPIVSSYLSNSPTPFKKIQTVRIAKGELAIVVNTSSSAGFTAEQLAERGAAICGLASKISQARPVAIYFLAEGDLEGIIQVTTLVKIASGSIDLDVVSNFLCSASLTRRVHFTFEKSLLAIYDRDKRYSGDVDWIKHSSKYSSPAFGQKERSFGSDMSEILDREVLYIPSIHWDQQKIMADPVTWLQSPEIQSVIR